MEVGNVRIVNGPWVQDFLSELLDFPNGAHDDQVDAMSGAFARLASVQPVRLRTYTARM
jgi:predicted phage terminase large subunit-like protein